MGYNNRNRQQGNGRFERGNTGNFRRGKSEMHSAVCSNCGNDCQVPFKPTGEKPVYCSDCFEKMGGQDTRRRFSRDDQNTGRSRQNSSSFDNKQLQEINYKLDKILRLLTPEKTGKENTEKSSSIQDLLAQDKSDDSFLEDSI